MECPYCKAVNRDGVRYCGSCGKLINYSNTATVMSVPTNARLLTPGSKLQGGRYVIKKVLGQGGMGAAMLAIDLRLDSKFVVIKELIAEQNDSQKLQDDVRNFKREVALLAHIDHPLVPGVTDHFQEGTRYFMVQEYVEGENLEEHLERTGQSMAELEALICASEVLDILDYLSQQNPPIVHRDIKPANIIIGSKDRRAHLVDFGIARAQLLRNAQRQQTSALGTPGYAPPEQYQGNADPRSDLYALGATLHHVLTNRDPRNSAPFTYLPVRSLNPALSPECEQVLNRAVVNDSSLRYQSAAVMKRDIDNILHVRYGLSGNINSYVVSTSGSIQVVHPQSGTMGGQPALSGLAGAPTLIGSAGFPTTPTSLAGSNPYSSAATSQRSPQSSRRVRGGLIALALVLVLLLIGSALGGALYLSQPKKDGNTPASDTGIGIIQKGKEPIGISDGTFIFDTDRSPEALRLKQQAATKLKNDPDNPASIIPLLRAAVDLETNDAESLIYLENARVLTSGKPFVTLVVATMLSGSSALLGVGRENLQGAYIAQKEYNDGAKLAGGVQVRLLIANSGSKKEYAQDVAQRIVRLSKADATFAGVMGWSFSSRSLVAVRVLTTAKVPMVSPTSTSDELTNISPYFFRVAPPNKIQGIIGARYARDTLRAHTAVIFVDPEDAYSQSLAEDFARQFEADGNRVLARENYTVDDAASISARVEHALAQRPELIYFSGYAHDVSALLVNLPSGKLPILGGDALYELQGYPTSARANFSRLHFTALAYPDQWDVLGYGRQKPLFFNNYANAFDPSHRHHGSPYGYSRPANDVILAYDATQALLRGCDSVLRTTGKTIVTPVALQQALKDITGAKSFQGVSGQISFGPDGDPIAKAIVMLYVDSGGHIRMESRVPPGTRFLK